MSDTFTNGFRIQVAAEYLVNQSKPSENKHLFSYRVKITNESSEEYTLISRNWIITNSFGKIKEVRGAGVVGEKPTIYPSKSFEYTSFVFGYRMGTMEGKYQMQKNDGSMIEAIIDKFLLSRMERIKH
jgi:ApaG protein